MGLVVGNMGLVDVDSDVPPACPPAQTILPSFCLPKQNRANCEMTKTKSTQPRFLTTSPTLYLY